MAQAVVRNGELDPEHFDSDTSVQHDPNWPVNVAVVESWAVLRKLYLDRPQLR